MSRTGLVTIAVRFHEVPHYRRVGEHCIRACLHTRASVPQAHPENRAVAERRYRHQYVYRSAAESAFEKQVSSLRGVRDLDPGRTSVKSELQPGDVLLSGMF